MGHPQFHFGKEGPKGGPPANSGGSTLFSNVASGTAVTEGNFTAYGHARVNGQMVAVPSLMRRRESEYNVYANGVYDSSH